MVGTLGRGSKNESAKRGNVRVLAVAKWSGEVGQIGRLTGWLREARQRADELKDIAKALNAASVPTARGGQWHPTTVKLVLERLAATA